MNVYVYNCIYIYVCVWELGMVYVCGILTHAFLAGGSSWGCACTAPFKPDASQERNVAPGEFGTEYYGAWCGNQGT